MTPARRALLVLGLFAVSGAGAAGLWERPRRLIVGAGPGSFPDLVARQLGREMAARVDNRAGAGGVLAIHELLQAPADGETLALATLSQLVLNPLLFRDLSYRPERDLQPVGLLLSGGLVVVAHASLKIGSLPELLALARRQPGGLDFAVPAYGSPPHVVLALLMQATGARFNVVPFKTGAEAAVELAAGRVPLFIDALPVVAPLLQQQRLRALAVTSTERLPGLPGTPTVAEQGHAGFAGETWMGLVVRRGVAAAHVERLSQALAGAQRSEAMQAFMRSSGAHAVAASPAEFAAFIQAESRRWGRLVEAAQIRLDPAAQ